MQYISDFFTNCKTFRIKKVDISALTIDGSDVQLIKTIPSTTENNADTRWCEQIVQPRTVSADAVSMVGASYYTGFQNEKVVIAGTNTNWVCLTAEAGQEWRWVENQHVK